MRAVLPGKAEETHSARWCQTFETSKVHQQVAADKNHTNCRHRLITSGLYAHFRFIACVCPQPGQMGAYLSARTRSIELYVCVKDAVYLRAQRNRFFCADHAPHIAIKVQPEQVAVGYFASRAVLAHIHAHYLHVFELREGDGVATSPKKSMYFSANCMFSASQICRTFLAMLLFFLWFGMFFFCSAHTC